MYGHANVTYAPLTYRVYATFRRYYEATVTTVPRVVSTIKQTYFTERSQTLPFCTRGKCLLCVSQVKFSRDTIFI